VKKESAYSSSQNRSYSTLGPGGPAILRLSRYRDKLVWSLL